MNLALDKFRLELDNILTFWSENMTTNKNHIVPELSNNNIPNMGADMGSMYLARIIYGASAACKALYTSKYLALADLCFEKLRAEFKNPQGGFFWAKNTKQEFIHDSDNVNMAQAFILYGLVEYASIKPEHNVLSEIQEQVSFIENTLKDTINGGYLDGFTKNWEAEVNQTKALGTHLHLLEAFTKLYEFNGDKKVVPIIEELIKLILQNFIDNKSTYCLHRLSPDWKVLPNFVWAGHNAECSWIICKSARIIENKHLINESEKMALKMMKQVLDEAYDEKNGGLFNDIKNGIPTENYKVWWPQAETAIALLNCYQITKENSYLELFADITRFISATIISPNGEWFTEVSTFMEPNPSLPKIHFWKSLYHNVRYYIEVLDRLENKYDL